MKSGKLRKNENFWYIDNGVVLHQNTAWQRCVFSQFLWLKVLLSWYFLVSKNTKLWSFSSKFDELIYNNVNNTFMKNGFMACQPSSLLLSPHIVNEPCIKKYLCSKKGHFRDCKFAPSHLHWMSGISTKDF